MSWTPKEGWAKRQKTIRDARMARGCCVYCRKKPLKGFRTCRHHREYMKTAAREWRGEKTLTDRTSRTK